MPDKFKSGEQLLKAYEMLEAAFTRKSQRLKELLEENARLKGELMEKQPDLSGMIEDFKAYPEGAQYAPGLSAVLQSEPNLTPAGLLAALARVIKCECVPREQLLQDREFVEKYVLTNEDITEYILRKYLGGLLRGETPRSISGAAALCLPANAGALLLLRKRAKWRRRASAAGADQLNRVYTGRGTKRA